MDSSSPVRKSSIPAFVLGAVVGIGSMLAITAVPPAPLKAWFPGFGDMGYWQQAQQVTVTPTPTPTPEPTPTSATPQGNVLTTEDLSALLRAYLDDPKRCPSRTCSNALVPQVVLGAISGTPDHLVVTYYTYTGDHKAPYDASKWMKHVESVGNVPALAGVLAQCQASNRYDPTSPMGCPQYNMTGFCSEVMGAGGMAKEADDPVCQQYEQDNPDGGVSEMYNTGHRGFER